MTERSDNKIHLSLAVVAVWLDGSAVYTDGRYLIGIVDRVLIILCMDSDDDEAAGGKTANSKNRCPCLMVSERKAKKNN